MPDLLDLRFVPERPSYNPPMPPSVRDRYSPDEIEELLCRVRGVVMDRNGRFISLGADPLTKLRTDQELHRSETEDRLRGEWSQSPAVQATAEIEMSMARERAQDRAEEQQREAARHAAADRMFQAQVAAGVPITEARDNVRRQFADLDW
ncbi:hypothetical protein [Actinoplanes subtropicus]|uniref:hypothetical protein n=1 Tax=Actinoplanes subtropicus TaxID=543632 RepID=UPI0004C35FC6|nr:hypothetical protein [Actinoplanes subtropicus]